MSTLTQTEAHASATLPSLKTLAVYLILGIYFGILLMKGEVASWFRIQEMFRFQSIHMYGVIGSAVAVGALSIALIRRLRLRDSTGQPIQIADPEPGANTRYWIGGTLFGVGWGLLGACPAPIFALIGSGISVMLVALLGALLGTWAYGYLRPRLPH